MLGLAVDRRLAIAANVGFLFRWLPYLERFEAARSEGFDTVEFAWPPVPIGDVVAAIAHAGLRVALINVHGGQSERGDRGYASDPSRRAAWRAAYDETLAAARRLACPAINVVAGNRVEGQTAEGQLTCLEGNLRWALDRAEHRAPRLLVEVLNAAENPAYLFTEPDPVINLVARLGDPRVAFQFDAYHLAFLGDAAAAFTRTAPFVGHVQIADHPGRHEPGTGAIDFAALFRAMGSSGYRGAIGLEYVPSAEGPACLDWLPRALRDGATAEELAEAVTRRQRVLKPQDPERHRGQG